MTRLTHAAYAAMVGLILGGAVALSGQSSITPAQFINGGGTPSGPILANTGCTVIPYSFLGRTTTGFCSPAADAVSGYAGNTEIWRTTTSGVDIGANAWLFGSSVGTSDVRCRRTGTKTLTCDDGAGATMNFAIGASDMILTRGGAAFLTLTNSGGTNAVGLAFNVDTKTLFVVDSAGNDTGIVKTNRFKATGVAFASLGTPANGEFLYCSDCTVANPCAGSGTGALAKRLNGAWVCN